MYDRDSFPDNLASLCGGTPRRKPPRKATVPGCGKLVGLNRIRASSLVEAATLRHHRPHERQADHQRSRADALAGRLALLGRDRGPSPPRPGPARTGRCPRAAAPAPRGWPPPGRHPGRVAGLGHRLAAFRVWTAGSTSGHPWTVPPAVRRAISAAAVSRHCSVRVRAAHTARPAEDFPPEEGNQAWVWAEQEHAPARRKHHVGRAPR